MGFAPVVLGRTGLMVGRLGVAASYGVPTKAVEEAFEQGVNYLYWGTYRREGMGKAVRAIVKRNREKAVVVLQSYTRLPWFLSQSVESGLKRLELDYADVLILGMFNRTPRAGLLRAARILKEQGKVRFLGISTHNRKMVPVWEKDRLFDVYHIRYNAVHTGAERDIFPHLASEDGPGIVAFTVTNWGQLVSKRRIPRGEEALTAADCYRFALSHPAVHVAITGPKNAREMRENLEALELGPLSPEEMARIRRLGERLYRK